MLDVSGLNEIIGYCASGIVGFCAWFLRQQHQRLTIIESRISVLDIKTEVHNALFLEIKDDIRDIKRCLEKLSDKN